MSRWQRRLVFLVAEATAILVVHGLLLRHVGAGDMISDVLAAGPHTPRGTLAVIGLFFLARLMAVLVLPGIVVYRLALVWMDLRSERPRRPFAPSAECG